MCVCDVVHLVIKFGKSALKTVETHSLEHFFQVFLPQVIRAKLQT